MMERGRGILRGRVLFWPIVRPNMIAEPMWLGGPLLAATGGIVWRFGIRNVKPLAMCDLCFGANSWADSRADLKGGIEGSLTRVGLNIDELKGKNMDKRGSSGLPSPT